MALKLTSKAFHHKSSISSFIYKQIQSNLSYTPRNITFISSTPFQISTPSQHLPFCFHSISSKNSIKKFGFSGVSSLRMVSGYTRIPAVSCVESGGSGGGGEGEGEGEGGRNSNGGSTSWYRDRLAKFPVLTKAVTSALLTLIGDVICQLVIDKAPTLDYKRTFIFTFLGMALAGPTRHFWHLSLSKLVTEPGVYGAFLRLLLDQFIFAPIFIGVFLLSVMTLEGRASQIVPKLQQEWFPLVLASCQMWISFPILKSLIVPQRFQVPVSYYVALIWNVILSFHAHKEVVEK